MESRNVLRMGVIAFVVASALAASSAVLAANGAVTLDFTADKEDNLLALRTGSDGRIYALVDLSTGAHNCGVFALDESGTLIASYAGAGRLYLKNECTRDIAVRADNSLVTATSDGAGVNLVFYGADGSQLSLSATRNPVLTGERIDGFAPAVQPDNKVLLAGRTVTSISGWVAHRWNADGKVDEDFDTPGLAIFNDAAQARADGLVALPGGGFLVSGITGPTNYQTAVYRRKGDGTADTTFATSGLYAVPGFVLPEAHASGALAVDSASKVYLLPATGVDVIRLTTNGMADSTFTPLTTPVERSPQSIVIDGADSGAASYTTQFTSTTVGSSTTTVSNSDSGGGGGAFDFLSLGGLTALTLLARIRRVPAGGDPA